MKRVIAAFLLAIFAGAAFAADRSGPVVRGPLDMRDPPMNSASGGGSLPELPGSTDAAKMFGGMQPRPLPGERAPLVGNPYRERLPYPGPRPYWESDPLFIAPPQ